MIQQLPELRTEAEQELRHILNYWATFAVDHRNSGFYGKITNENVPDPGALKGSVLNARILWSFSAGYDLCRSDEYLAMATRAFDFIKEFIIDKEHGGVYWTVDSRGAAVETKKQLYACAFVLYGLSEYTCATANAHAKELAIQLYRTVVDKGFDEIHGGFYEAFSRDWQTLSDQRLSSKDENEKKSANTNLHILEAFASLYLIWPDEVLKQHIADLLNIFYRKIIDKQTGHLLLFFDERWNPKASDISYGHDVEAGWLLYDCARIIGDAAFINSYKNASITLVNAAMEGLHTDGGLWYESDKQHYLVKQKHWWPQAEALVGFYHAWQLTGDDRYSDACIRSWNFIQSKMKCPSGEWYWGIHADGSPMEEDKVGLWKCPYHNSRACIEIVRRSST